jgi:LysR family transcriptional regulator for bpeEF and oprC
MDPGWTAAWRAMDKLRAIKFFCRAAETKSFTSAANALDVPQSVLSKTIAALEEELQFALFNRTTRRVSLTEAGAAYYDRCRQVMDDLEEAETLGRNGAVLPTGTLHVGIHPVFQISLCRRIGEFLASNPGVNIDLAHANSPAALLEEGLDVVLRIGSIADSTLVARPLGSTSIIACASPGYLDRHGRPEHPQDLSGHHGIVPGHRHEDTYARWTFFKGNQREVVTVPVGVVLREGVGLAVTAIGGVGIVQLFDIAARPFIEDGDLEPILQDWSCGREPVYALFPGRRNVPAKVRAFVEFARTLILAAA